jgi:Flp pilus assembly protein protease CpaA
MQSDYVVQFFNAWVFTGVVFDYLYASLPNELALIGLLAALALRGHAWTTAGFELLQFGTLLLAAFIALGFWVRRIWGGGDAKFLMILLLAFPSNLLALIVLSLLALFVAVKYASRRVKLTSKKQIADVRAIIFMGMGWFVWLSLGVR